MAIYYRCPDKDYPVGGIRVIYSHVDILNRNGFPAFVLHHYHPFRCTWFENAVGRVLDELEHEPAALARRVEQASRFVGERYSPDREERDLAAIWSELWPRE
jgi:hypothetical protein